MKASIKSVLLSLITTFASTGCGTKEAAEYSVQPRFFGNTIRSDYEDRLEGLLAKRADKNESLEALAGRATRVESPQYFRSLSGEYEGTTINIGAEALREWDDWFAKSSETYHVTGEAGNDFMLFFNTSRHLVHYSHY